MREMIGVLLPSCQHLPFCLGKGTDATTTSERLIWSLSKLLQTDLHMGYTSGDPCTTKSHILVEGVGEGWHRSKHQEIFGIRIFCQREKGKFPQFLCVKHKN